MEHKYHDQYDMNPGGNHKSVVSVFSPNQRLSDPEFPSVGLQGPPGPDCFAQSHKNPA